MCLLTVNWCQLLSLGHSQIYLGVGEHPSVTDIKQCQKQHLLHQDRPSYFEATNPFKNPVSIAKEDWKIRNQSCWGISTDYPQCHSALQRSACLTAPCLGSHRSLSQMENAGKLLEQDKGWPAWHEKSWVQVLPISDTCHSPIQTRSWSSWLRPSRPNPNFNYFPASRQ